MNDAGSRSYFRPLPCPGSRRGVRQLAGGTFGFHAIEVLSRKAPPEIVPVEAAAELWPEAVGPLSWMSEQRAPVAGMRLDRPLVMGVLNATDDSFSDGGRYADPSKAIAHGMEMAAAGADIIDIGGESTRPGANPVGEQQELDRVMPVIEGLMQADCAVPLSIDTRKAVVARAAARAGVSMFNDVSALSYDGDSLRIAPGFDAVCLMHAQGDPRTMQQNPVYSDVLLDVYDYLAERIVAAEAAGVDRSRIIIDPGIGFGKRLEHNLALLRRLSLFHGLGCPIMLGVSRKRFIGTLSGVAEADRRAPGSIAAGLAGLGQGAQILRVHDVAETVQALRVWQAIEGGEA